MKTTCMDNQQKIIDICQKEIRLELEKSLGKIALLSISSDPDVRFSIAKYIINIEQSNKNREDYLKRREITHGNT
jgi:hypothetical protein